SVRSASVLCSCFPLVFFYLHALLSICYKYPSRKLFSYDVLDGHVLVVADVIDVLAAALSGDQHIVGGLGPGEADAPRFFADLERAVVLDPGALIGQQNRGRLGTGGRGQDGAETHFATPRISRRIDR